MKIETDKLSAAAWSARLGDEPQLTPAEKAALTDFLRESPTHVRELIEHTFIGEDLKALPIPRQQLDKWIAEARAPAAGAIPFPDACAQDALRDAPQAKLPRPRLGRRLLVAASLAAALLIGGVFVYSRMGLYTTAFGEQRILTLADGSVVTLNTESKMKVDFSDRKRSIALLQGEAFFRVAHDTARPFLVSVDHAVVRAVGTQFNVRMAPQKTVVSVVDGVVKVSLNQDFPGAEHLLPVPRESAGPAAGHAQATGPGGTSSSGSALGAGERPAQGQDLGFQGPTFQITVSKGEEARVARNELAGGTTVPPLSKIATPAALRAASWTQGRLEFEGTPLSEVLAEFRRYRQFEAAFADDGTRQLEFTGSVDSHDLDSFLAYLETVPGLTVDEKRPGSYFIHHR